jgi:hypothetical protein
MKRVLLCAALLAWSGLASAVVYKWVDAQGKVQYGDRPPDGVHAEVVELLGTHTARPASSASDSRPTANTPATNKPSEQDAATKKAVDADVAQSKEKQCADAQDLYKKLIEGRKLYKTGADGDRQYLTSEEIDKARIDAKQSVDTACNSPT